MGGQAVEGPVEREYRNFISDNLRWDEFVAPARRHLRVHARRSAAPRGCRRSWPSSCSRTAARRAGLEVAPWIDARFEPVDVVATVSMRRRTVARSRRTPPPTASRGIRTASYIVVGRDGRDACMSFLNHLRNMQPELMVSLAMSAIEDGIDLGDDGPPPPVDDVHAVLRLVHRREPDVVRPRRVVLGRTATNPTCSSCTTTTCRPISTPRCGGSRSSSTSTVDEARWPAARRACTFAVDEGASDEIADFEGHFVGGADTFLYKGTTGAGATSSPPTSSRPSTGSRGSSSRPRRSRGRPRGERRSAPDVGQGRNGKRSLAWRCASRTSS